MRIPELMRAISDLQGTVKDIETGVLEEFICICQDEIKRRMPDLVLPPMTDWEMKLGKVEAIRAYRGRTGMSLTHAFEAWRRVMGIS